MSHRSKIIAAIKLIAKEQKVDLPPLTNDLFLNETGLDSLAFAILIARLEDDLGIDPFTMSQSTTPLVTIGDLVRSYENVHA
jgi:acyl carrier protein